MTAYKISSDKAIQDHYDDKYDQCYGCGPHNPDGLQIKSFWQHDGVDGRVTAQFQPCEKHRGIEGFVYGGLLASLVDCHAMAAAAANYANTVSGVTALPRFVTGTLNVKYLKPTPLNGKPIELEATITEQAGRRSTVQIDVSVDGVITAEGTVIAFHIPEAME